MRRRWIVIVLLAALIALAAVQCFSAGGACAPTQEIAFSGERDSLRATLTYDAGTRTLRGTQTMELTNRTDAALEGVVLRAYMNGESEDAIAVTGAAVNGQAVSVSADKDDPTVLRVAHEWAAGETIQLRFTVMIRHTKADGAAIITLPSPAMLEGGVWREDAYDPLAGRSYAQAFDFTVSVDGEIAAQMRGARDASFALLEGGKAREKEVSGVRIRALAQNVGAAKTLLAQAQAAMESLQDIGIDYPFDVLTVAQGDASMEDGTAYSGLIVLNAQGSKEELRRRITRLIAQETFGILIENDPWLSMALASSCELLAYRKLKGDAAYEERFYAEIEPATRVTRPQGVSIGSSTAHFGSDSEMTQVLRDQGAAMLLGIEQAVGGEAFVAALNTYVGSCAGGTGTRSALEAALEEATGSSWEGYLADELSQ